MSKWNIWKKQVSESMDVFMIDYIHGLKMRRHYESYWHCFYYQLQQVFFAFCYFFLFQFLLAVTSSLFKVVQKAIKDTSDSNGLSLKLFLWVLMMAIFACSTWSGIVALSLSFFVNIDERLKKKWKIAAFSFGTTLVSTSDKFLVL